MIFENHDYDLECDFKGTNGNIGVDAVGASELKFVGGQAVGLFFGLTEVTHTTGYWFW